MHAIIAGPSCQCPIAPLPGVHPPALMLAPLPTPGACGLPLLCLHSAAWLVLA